MKITEGKKYKGGINTPPTTPAPAPPKGQGAEQVAIRQFDTGANRDTAVGKLCYSKFLSPTVLKRYAEYMNKNRQLADGTLRPGNNWQKGIPKDVYMESAWRHFHDWWTIHEGREATDHTGKNVELEEALCAIIFNAMGYLFEVVDPKSASNTKG